MDHDAARNMINYAVDCVIVSWNALDECWRMFWITFINGPTSLLGFMDMDMWKVDERSWNSLWPRGGQRLFRNDWPAMLLPVSR
jgi:hypothetical protein